MDHTIDAVKTAFFCYHASGLLCERYQMLSRSSETKLQRYFSLADSVRSLVNELIAEGSKRLESGTQDLTLRERVLIGLAVKAYNSFECLTQDAKMCRS